MNRIGAIASSTPGRCFSSQKRPLYGASRESRAGIATLKERVTQNRRERNRERNLLFSAIVIFSKKREKVPGAEDGAVEDYFTHSLYFLYFWNVGKISAMEIYLQDWDGRKNIFISFPRIPYDCFLPEPILTELFQAQSYGPKCQSKKKQKKLSCLGQAVWRVNEIFCNISKLNYGTRKILFYLYFTRIIFNYQNSQSMLFS